MSFAAADADPVSVSTLNRNDVRNIYDFARLQCGESGRITVLRVQNVKRFGGVFAFDDFDDAANVRFKVAAVLFADEFKTDDFDACDGGAPPP
jgi:hypothetical protein